MTQLKPGDRVNVTITDAKVVRTIFPTRGGHKVVVVELAARGYANGVMRIELDGEHHAITFERCMPQHWPPQVGDVWVVTGDGESCPWLAVNFEATSKAVVFVSTYGRQLTDGELLDQASDLHLRWRDGMGVPA